MNKNSEINHKKLWYLNGRWYDFSSFIEKHPGGRKAIILGRGTDSTSLFKCYHTSFPLERLQKYEIREQVTGAPYAKLFSYAPEGFFNIVRNKVYTRLEQNSFNPKAGIFEWLFLSTHLFLYITTFLKGIVEGWIFYIIAFGMLRGLLYTRTLHAASHYELHEKPYVNEWVSILCSCLASSIPAHWSAQHVRDHHCFPNIYPIDNDSAYPVKVIFSGMKRPWWTRYQHLYTPMIFSLASLHYFVSDAIRIFIDTLQNPRHENLRERWFVILIQAVFKAVPFALHDLGTAILMTLLTEVITSVFVISQTVVNHELAETTRCVPRQGVDWGEWQMQTCHNWSTGSLLANHISGGLNHQIEHHLFPEIHYRHYPRIASIVRREAHRFGVPYYESKSLVEALHRHFTHLQDIAHS